MVRGSVWEFFQSSKSFLCLLSFCFTLKRSLTKLWKGKGKCMQIWKIFREIKIRDSSLFYELPVIIHIHSFKLISRETYNGRKILTFSHCVMVFTWMGKLLSCHEIFGRNIYTHKASLCTYRSLHNFIIIQYIVRHGKMMFAWPLAPWKRPKMASFWV